MATTESTEQDQPIRLTPEQYACSYSGLCLKDSKKDDRPNVAYFLIRFPDGACGCEQRFDGHPMFPRFAEMGAVDVAEYRRGRLVSR